MSPPITRWSNLPLSGVFVEMLDAIVDARRRRMPARREPATAADAGARGGSATQARRGATLERLDGFGRLAARRRAAPVADIDEAARQPARHPPGFYGRDGTVARLNIVRPADARLTPLARPRSAGRATSARSIAATGRRRSALAARGARRCSHPRRPRRVAAGGRRCRCAAATPARRGGAICCSASARCCPAPADRAPRRTRQADADGARRNADRPGSPMSSPATPRSTRPAEAGLTASAQYLGDAPRSSRATRWRSIRKDELAFFPLLYWPIDAERRPMPSAETLAQDRRLHEAGRHDPLRHARRQLGGDARARRNDAGAERLRADPRRSSTCRRSSRCRATTC